MNMGKTVLITGGAGFIGSHLVKKLLFHKYKVIVVDNLSSFYKPSWKTNNIKPFLKHPSFVFYNANILSLEKLKKIVSKHPSIDTVIHLAAQPGTRLSFIKPLLYEKTNIQGTYKLLEVMKNRSIKNFIFASSSSVYGNTTTPFNESSETKPLSLYGATKLAGEQILYAYHKNFHIPTTILRFFSVYGPNGRPDMAPYLFTKAIVNNKKITVFGKGETLRDWTYIDDITEGIYACINKTYKFEIINLGNSKPVLLHNMLSIIENNTKRKFSVEHKPLRDDEPRKTYADITKAKKMLNWQPKTNFKAGMKLFIKWYIENR